ncbi:MAG: helix-turn-helix, type 11 domain protein [Verrucomicrobiales bacterium]|nr:helix-turn-helix, type 11 domain protein [Verrucomicrobiales bacterium]
MNKKGKKNGKPKQRSKKDSTTKAKIVRGLTHVRLRRIAKIREEIAANRFPNKQSLAKLLEVSPEVLDRDIAAMKMDLPIAFDFKENGYCFTEPVSNEKGMRVTRTELIATLFLSELGKELKGTCWEKAIESICEKVAAGFPEDMSFRPSDWSRIMSVRKKGATTVEPENLELLVNAIADKETLHVTYMNGDEKVSDRDINPLHLERFEDNLYLVAYDHNRQKELVLAAWRVKPITRTGRTFAHPPGFTAAGFFKHSLGIHGPEGDKLHVVVIRFRQKVALKIKERVWNALQKMEILPDGSVELHFKLNGLTEVSRLLLTWMPEIISISPPELLAMHAANMKQGNENLAKMQAL